MNDQRSLYEQLLSLLALANKAGHYDAAEWLLQQGIRPIQESEKRASAMKTERADVFIFAANLAGDERAADLRADKQAQGFRIEDKHETIAGALCRVITVRGRRIGEGQIAKSVKSLRTSTKV